MLEKLTKRLVPYGRAHPLLRWPILVLLALFGFLNGVWVITRAVCREAWKVGREGAQQIRESGLTSQGSRDDARPAPAVIPATKKRLGLWRHFRQAVLPRAMASVRAVFHAARQWCLARMKRVKAAVAVGLAWAKSAVRGAGCGLVKAVRRAAAQFRADLPQYRRHAPQRAIAASLALVLCLGLLPVSAFGAETACTHLHDESCYHRALTCGKAEAHAHSDACYTDQPVCGKAEAEANTHNAACYTQTQTCGKSEHSHSEACYGETGELVCTQEEHTHDGSCETAELTCGQEATEGHAHSDACYTTDPICGKAEIEGHSHTDACYTETLDCKHVHDATCGGLPQEPEIPAVPECTCGAIPDADGATVHAEDCPLYTAPEEPVCATCAQAHKTADCPVEAVRALIAALPTPEEIATMTEEEREESGAYAKMEAAYNAYEALTDAQKALLPDAMDTFTALQEALGAPAWMAAQPPVDVDWDYICANGWPLVIEAGTNPDYTNIFVDRNGDGKLSGYEEWLKIGNKDPTPEGYNLSEYFEVHGGSSRFTEGGSPTGFNAASSKITMTGGRVRDIWGGNTECDMTGTAEVTITGGTVTRNVYGGGRDEGMTATNTIVTIAGGTVMGDVYGGGDTSWSGNHTKTATVIMTGGTVRGDLYGGGERNSDDYLPKPDVNVTDRITVSITGGTVNGIVYGGEGNLAGGRVPTTVTVGGSAKVYYGVRINCDDEYEVTRGVDSFTIEPALQADANIGVYLDVDCKPGITVATGAVATDLARITLMGPSAPKMAPYLDGGDIKMKASTPVTSVSLRDTNMVLGSKQTLTATVLPEDATYKTVKWTSSDPAVAFVDAATGLVSARQLGTATITATSNWDKNLFATCTVTVAMGGEELTQAVTTFNPNVIYTIKDQEQLARLATLVNSGQNGLNTTFRLVEDIALTGPWTPIGTKDKSFKGTFDGQGNTISGLSIHAPDADYQGLFGYAGYNSVVKNVTVEGSVVGREYVGGVVGNDDGKSLLNCVNHAAVSGTIYVGGVVGYSAATITGCANHGTVTGSGTAGGIAGRAISAAQKSYNTGAVSGSTAGGIVGNGGAQACFNTGAITGTSNAGGICGDADTTIQNCYNTGNVVGSNTEANAVGGIVGVQYSSVQNCYNIGTVTSVASAMYGRSYVGGIVGRRWGSSSTANCTSLGVAVVNQKENYPSYRIGNTESGTTTAGYARKDMVWKKDSSVSPGTGTADGADITVGTDAQAWNTWFDATVASSAWNAFSTGTLQLGEALPTLAGFDGVVQSPTLPAVAESVAVSPSPLTLALGGAAQLTATVVCAGDYNVIWSSSDASRVTVDQTGRVTGVAPGSATVTVVAGGRSASTTVTVNQVVELTDKVTEFAANTVYTIKDQTQLAKLATLVNGGKSGSGTLFLLEADIALTGAWTPIGTSTKYFSGTFDGQGHTISGLSISGTGNRIGLFGCIRGNGMNRCTIRNLIVEGSVKGDSYIGGVAGMAYGYTVIENCVSRVAVTGLSEVGGVVGIMAQESGGYGEIIIRNCYATGAVTCTGNSFDPCYLGGIVGSLGRNDYTSVVENCYATGTISTTNSSLTIVAGGIAGTVSNKCTVKNCVALNLSVTGKTDVARIAGELKTGGTLENNYARADMKVKKAVVTDGTSTNRNGADIALGAPQDWNTWFGSTAGWLLPMGALLAGDEPLPALLGESAPTLPSNTVTVTFYDGATAYGADTPQKPQAVEKGSAAAEPTAPTKAGFDFSGWYTSDTGGTKWSFTTPVTAKTDLYARWTGKALGFTGAALGDGVYNSAYTAQVPAPTNGTGSYTYALAAGASLPDGLTLASDGQITGTLAAAVNRYSVQITATDTGSKATKIAAFTMQVKPLQLTVAAPTLTTEKVYNNTTAAAVTAGALTNAKEGDAVTVTATAAYDSAAVGAGKTITVTYSISGAAAKNYTAPVAATITGGKITKAAYDMTGVRFSNVTPVYDGAAHAPAISGTLPTGLDGVPVSVSYSGSATQVSDGTVTVTATFATASGNYEAPAPMTATVTIAPRTVTVTWDGTNAFEYDGTKKTVTATLGGKICSDDVAFTYDANASATNKGNYTAQITGLTGTAAGNYQLPVTGLTQAWSIGAKSPTLGQLDVTLPTDVIYDGAAHSASIAAKPDADDIGEITVLYALQTGGTYGEKTANAPVNVGTYQVTASLAAKGNYGPAELAAGTFTIAKRPVTITAADQTVPYQTPISQSDAHYTLSAGGLVSGHTATVTLTQSTQNVTSDGKITPSAAMMSGANDVSANYAITPVVGKLVITGVTYPNPPAAPSVTATFGQKLSDLTPTAVSGGAWSWKNGETIPTVVNGGYAVIFTPTDTNYAPFELTATVHVTPKALTLPNFAATGREFAPGDTSVSYEAGVLSGLVSGFETVLLVTDGVSASIDKADQGTRNVTLSGALTLAGADAGNYTLTQPTGITVTIAAKPYGDGQGFTIAAIADQPFTGVEIKPEPVVQFGGVTLVYQTDYTLGYDANTAIGTGKVNIAFQGNYSGSAATTFCIVNNPLPAENFEKALGVSADAIKLWHSADITLNGQDGWKISVTADDFAANSVTLSTEGTQSTQVIYLQKTGETKVYQTTVVYALDKTVPTVSDVTITPAGWTDSDATITFAAADETSGVASVSVKDSAGKDYPVTDNKSFVADKNDTYTITVIDNAGKTTTESVAVTKIDKATLTAPTVTGYTSAVWTKDTITFTLATGDTVSSGTKFQVKVADADWADVSGSTYAVTDNANGVAYAFRTMSGAGAVSETVNFVVRLDKTTPVVNLAATAGGAAYIGAATAHDVIITPSNTATNISGQIWYYQKTGDADWTALAGDALTVNFNCDTTFMFKAVSGAGAESATESITVQRSALKEEDLAETEYGKDDLSVSKTPGETGWYTEVPTITVEPQETVGAGGLKATTYYELVKAPETSGTKTELTAPWTITPGGDGQWTLKIWTEDAAGNRTNAYETTFDVDRAAPAVSEALTPSVTAGTWSKDDITVSFTATDDTAGIASVQYKKEDGTLADCTPGADGSYTFTADENGTYTVVVTDKAGQTTEQTITISNIDKTLPTIRAVSVPTAPASGWHTEDVTVSVTATDAGGANLAEQAYSFDGGKTWQSEASKMYDASGDYSVTIWVKDAAGNITQRDAVAVHLDKDTPTAPTVTATAGGEAYSAGTFTGKDVAFSLSGTPTASGHAKYQVSTDSSAIWQDVTGSTLTHSTNTSDAGVNYRFRAVNVAGTPGTASADLTVKRRALDASVSANPDNVYQPDQLNPGQQPGVAPGQPGDPSFPYAPYWWPETPAITVPEIPYIQDPNGPVIPGTNPEIHGYAATTYYKLWRVGTDTEPAKQALTAPFAIKPTADGIWTLELWTEDSVGSETTHLVQIIQVDTAAPTITDVTGNATSWQKTDVTLTVNGAADETAGLADLAYSFDGGTTWQAESSKTFAANTTVTVWVRDRAGHSYQHVPIAIHRIDKTAPEVTWSTDTLALDPDKWYGAGLAVTANATDDSGEAPTIVLKAGGKTYENGGALQDSGVFSFTATATDAAGNTGKSTVYTVRIEPKINELAAKVAALGQNPAYSDLLQAKLWYDALGKTTHERLSKNDEAKAAYDALLELLHAKADEAVSGVTDKIQGADTLVEIEQAKKDYDALPEDVKQELPAEIVKELEKKAEDAQKAKDVAAQVESADQASQPGKPGGRYEEKEAARDAYDKLTDDQKKLVSDENKGLYDSIVKDLAAIGAVLDGLEEIKKPYTAATKDLIQAVEDAFHNLTEKQREAFPADERKQLTDLAAMRDKAQAVEDKLAALGESPSLEALQKAKADYNSLRSDEKAMVDGTLQADLDQKYQEKLDQMTADEKATADFATKVEELQNNPTVEKIEQLVKDHDALSDAAKGQLSDETKDQYQKLVNDLEQAKEIIDKLDDIDLSKLTPEDLDKVQDALGKDSANGYDDLTEDQKKLVDGATGGKPGILADAVQEVGDVVNQVDQIPDHAADSKNPDGTPNLGDCENAGNSGADDGDTGGHDYAKHRKAIEDAKIAYEKLSDAGRKLVSDTVKEKLNGEYKALMAHLDYVSSAKTATTTVEVAGLAENVQLPADAATAAKTVITVVMKDEKPAVMPPVPNGKSEALSVDIKLVASIYNDAADAEPATRENVQPKRGEKVLVKLLLPTGYQNDTLEIWHVKDNGGRSRVADFWLVTEADGVHVVFEIGSFSHFVFYAERTPSGGGIVTPPAPKPVIPGADHGTTTVTPQWPNPGDSVAVTPKPDAGYVVDKIIVTNEHGKEIPVKNNGDGTYFYTQPEGKVTVTVTFKPAPTPGETPFADATPGYWFYESVKFVYEKGLMNGTTGNTFSPHATADRGMFVTILWRLEGQPEPKAANPFTDVTADAYYAKAVAWAAENGMVNGYGDGSFGPNNPITREQLVAILYRYTQHQEGDTTAKGDLTKFTDQPSAWAAEAVQWAVGAGILSGRDSGTLAPTATATRAEVAQMLFHLLA